MAMIKDYTNIENSTEVPLHLDGHAYPFQWPSEEDAGPLTTQNLPSLDYAIYLINTVKFHISQIYHLFDDEIFFHETYIFYQTKPSESSTAHKRLWYIQFLLVLAFGKAILVQDGFQKGVPGSEYFQRALNMLPDINGYYEDPLTSMELLCGISLYLQA